jgi:hypothetical protein
MRTKAIDTALKHIKLKAAKKSTGSQQISKKRKYALLEKLKGLGEVSGMKMPRNTLMS